MKPGQIPPIDSELFKRISERFIIDPRTPDPSDILLYQNPVPPRYDYNQELIDDCTKEIITDINYGFLSNQEAFQTRRVIEIPYQIHTRGIDIKYVQDQIFHRIHQYISERGWWIDFNRRERDYHCSREIELIFLTFFRQPRFQTHCKPLTSRPPITGNYLNRKLCELQDTLIYCNGHRIFHMDDIFGTIKLYIPNQPNHFINADDKTTKIYELLPIAAAKLAKVDTISLIQMLDHLFFLASHARILQYYYKDDHYTLLLYRP